MKVKVNENIKKHLMPLRSEELKQLEKSILNEGCRDPLVFWNDMLIDGHNRYKICTENNIDFKTVSREFPDFESVIEWVEDNQLGRRNLTPDQFKLLLGRKYNRLKNKQGGNGSNQFEQTPQNEGIATADKIAGDHGVSRATVERAGTAAKAIDQAAPELKQAVEQGQVSVSAAADVAELPKTEQAEIVAKGEKEILQAAKKIRAEKAVKRKEEKIQELKEAKPIEGKYRIIYADPPWKYGDTREQLTGTTGAEHHYPTMSIDELCAMPIKDSTEDNAVLFLWVTSPLLEDSFKVINSWGFKYKTSFVWDKVKHNMGHYNSVRHEFLLICTKGSCTPDEVTLYDSVVEIEKTKKHSEKPEKFREIIDSLYPYGSRLELFRRGDAPHGWAVWGNEVA